MDDDGCTRRRMFVLLQPLPYQVMSANSFKTKWKPEDVSGGLQDWGTRKVQLILCSLQRRRALEGGLCFPASRECKSQQGKGESWDPKTSSDVHSGCISESYRSVIHNFQAPETKQTTCTFVKKKKRKDVEVGDALVKMDGSAARVRGFHWAM